MRSRTSGPAARPTAAYDPFARGPSPVGVRTVHALDSRRARTFPCEIWYPAAEQHAGEDHAPGTQDGFTVPARAAPQRQMAVRNAVARSGHHPLIVFSHPSGGHRRSATFLCTHLSSHGYVVAALDHSEVVAEDMARRGSETQAQTAARVQAWIANRVPDIRFLLDHLLGGEAWDPGVHLDPLRIGIVGHSFGGWTALAAPDVEPRIRAVVALAPGGSSRPKPGIIPAQLVFSWGRDVPTLYLVAENDTFVTLDGMVELFERTPASTQMVILRRADHMHFMDEVEEVHERARAMGFTEDMRPVTELCSGDQAHLFVRGLTLCHMDATLRRHEAAQRTMRGDLEARLAALGVDVVVHEP